MNLKKITFIGILFIFLFSFVTHNLYAWFPNTLTSFFFPVNESIWEHQKMIFITILIWGLIEYILLKIFDLNHQNIIFATTYSAIFNILFFLIIYIPIDILIGHNMILTLLVYLFTIVISQLISYTILSKEKYYKWLNIISAILIPLIIIGFIILTYYPLPIDFLFYDRFENKYGIYNYYQ